MKEQRLTFVRRTGERSPDKHILALYNCACGNTCTVIESRVRNGYTRSCGCLIDEARGALGTHRQKDTPTYRSWSAMRTRCLNPKAKDFPRYGGKGIGIDPSWDSFEQFVSDMGERPLGTTLDRIKGSEGYCKGNCRWATPTEQSRNRKFAVRVNTDRGIEYLADYATRLGITNGAALMRLNRGKLEGATRAA